MYFALANTIICYVVGFLFTALFFQYPVSIGWERAFTIKTKWDCIFAGRHPDIQEVIGEQEVKGFEVKSPMIEVNGEVVEDYDASSSL